MVKCDICKAKIETTFLGKIKGTHLNVKGKLKLICPDCQKKYTKNELIKKL